MSIRFINSAIIGLLVLFCVSSCKKHSNTITINGLVRDPQSQANVSDVRVTLSSNTVTSGFYNPNYTDIGTTFTDANGAFSFEFEQGKTAGYRFYVYKEKYFDITYDVPEENIQPETPYTPTFFLNPEGYLKLHVKNSSPINSNDFIAYYYTLQYESCNDCCLNTVIQRYGTDYDTIFKCRTIGNSDVQIHWHVTKWGSDVIYADTVFCTPFDTTSYEILY